MQGGLRYDRNVNPRLFAFGAADFMSNALQFLDLRQVYTGGFGFHAIASDAHDARTSWAASTTRTKRIPTAPRSTDSAVDHPHRIYVSYGKTNKFVALTLGEELNHKLGKSTVVTQNFYFYPNLQQTGEYRWTFNWAPSPRSANGSAGRTSSATFTSPTRRPAPRSNDVIFTTGLNFSFTH